ncbi:MAG: DUF6496 domain-containing protein [Pseudomonadota bacterium]
MAAKKAKRKYSKASQTEVKNEMDRFKKGKARSGKGGAKVKSRKQAIAIGLSKARKKGKKVPKVAKKKTAKKKTAKKKAKKSARK